jgi:FkbM family methyltransferase
MNAFLFDDYRVEIDPRSAELGGSWQGQRRDGLPTAWDGDLLRFFYERMPDDCHFLDVGSATGSFCLLPALRPTSRCIAFEPVPLVRDILRANISLNGLEDRVSVFPYALWDQDGAATLRLPADQEMGLACLADEPTRFAPVGDVLVETRRLDGLVLGRIDMAKIDVEGAELMVLRGAAETLARDRPALLVEYDERNTTAFGYKPEKIMEFLKTLGYTHFEQLEADLWAT